jgi:Arylsulfotransferase (ASST)
VLLGTAGCRPADWISTIASSGQSGTTQSFRSRPDLRPPTVSVNVPASNGVAPGYVFVAVKKGEGQDGPMILDDKGHLVWFSKDRYATDFKVQAYNGEPVLTWWQGGIVAGHGEGEYVIFDSSYREVRRVKAGNGYKGDLHEFSITPHDTALLTIYNEARTDLSPIGGRKDGPVWDGVAQELDLETGEVLFEWRSLDHVGVGESYRGPGEDPEEPVDYFHINSIEVEPDGNFLIDAKGTYAVYKVDRESGEIIWRLGGKKSDFEMGEGTRTVSQHDARRQRDGTITIFDNGAPPEVHDQSRGIVVELDEDAMKATLVREYTHPEKPLSTSQGNMQVLPGGNVFIGWGTEPYSSEYSKDGRLIFDLQFSGETQSYRAFRQEWSGRPAEDPAIAAEKGKGDKVNVYASWNGATEATTWRVLAGPDPKKLEPVGSVPWEGFETAMAIRTEEPYVAVGAEDDSGRVLGTSEAVKPKA